jgi:transaldolase
MIDVRDLKIHIYADGADEAVMLQRRREGLVKGFTTNPTLLRRAGVTDYAAFARRVVAAIPDLPLSFGTCADDLPQIEREARLLGGLAGNVYVKVPITNTRGEDTLPVIRRLLDAGLRINVTALMSERQILGVRGVLGPGDDVIASIFAGRIADTGVDPAPIVRRAVEAHGDLPRAKILWASPREVLNVDQAAACGCHVITVSDDILARLALRGRDLDEYSLTTIRSFHDDARAAGLNL